MAYVWTIRERSRDVETGRIYALVDFYPTSAALRRRDRPVLTEEFLLLLQTEGTRRLPDGTIERYEIDPRQQMREVIEDFAVRAEAQEWRGDLTEGPPGVQARRRDEQDADGVLGRVRRDDP